MQIQNHNNTYNPQFGILHCVASCDKLKIHQVTDVSDIKKLKNLPSQVNIKDLMPGLSPKQYSRWQEMLEYAIDMMQNPGNITYIETLNNKICGIITYFPNKTTIIDCICTWPAIAGQKVKFAGKSLFCKVFSDFKENQGTRIKLDAITDGPYNTIDKYEPLGFKATTKVYPTKVEMEANKYKIKEILPELKSLTKYREIKAKTVDINDLMFN